ncbi:ABL084Cp [Eremothecium gossypii ATCC 10895]|uniref:ABL084Cp n=1 Tax=Eremothecium gossypii (strain ATCC 10895 / CBS 109.51 / FGSC 9923 / NRRL Y-1056) TaxID=284811 RepID=Q75DV7_EREGS|nr:ABL084Cp [Eremothecium gossypii ATCC 10895]AAS50687.2 ABL084Cp [Eremothecium gossypii ATCC 10895]AEY94975.1 FABL084Cp [Eremothecium gossypii FDAG1]
MSTVDWDGTRQILLRTPADVQKGFSFIEIVNAVDGLSYDYQSNPAFKEHVYEFHTHSGVPIGYILQFVVQEMRLVASTEFDRLFACSDAERYVKFKETDFETRNEQLETLAQQLRSRSSLSCLKGWRNEKYAVYVEHLPYVLIERALSSVFGIITYGVHMNGYLRDASTGELLIWVPRRSYKKATWPGMLDNVVAGGLGHPHGVYDTLLKESMEEAALPEEVIRNGARAVGVVSYFYHKPGGTYSTEADFITGEIEYLYDIQLPVDVIPKPNDDEVNNFTLMTLQQVVDALIRGDFKPNCGLIMLDFLVRHGYVNSDNEPHYLEIVTKMHRHLPFPTL